MLPVVPGRLAEMPVESVFMGEHQGDVPKVRRPFNGGDLAGNRHRHEGVSPMT